MTNRIFYARHIESGEVFTASGQWAFHTLGLAKKEVRKALRAINKNLPKPERHRWSEYEVVECEFSEKDVHPVNT